VQVATELEILGPQNQRLEEDLLQYRHHYTRSNRSEQCRQQQPAQRQAPRQYGRQ